jgi:enterochelin esterase-like enzyme
MNGRSGTGLGWERSVSLALVVLGGVMLAACSQATPTFTLDVPSVPASPTATLAASPCATPSATPGVVLETPTNSVTPVLSLSSTPFPTPPPTMTRTPISSPASPTPACRETQGRVESGTFFSGIIGQEQPYRVYLPPCYDYGDDLPVLYMIHGYPFDDSHWDDIGIDEAADAGISTGTLPSFIIAMPAADNEGTFSKTSGGAGSFEAVMLDEFIPFIESTYRAVGAPEGRAIGGMSRGGVWSLEIAFRNPSRFAAVGGHSVALNVNLAPQIYDPLYLAADPAIRSLRIYLDVGQGDWVLPGMDDLHAALTAADVPHDYRVNEGYHDDSYWSVHVSEYLAFYAAGW